MSPLDRRTLLKGAGAGLVLAGLPFKIPTVRASAIPVTKRTIRRYGSLRRLLRQYAATPEGHLYGWDTVVQQLALKPRKVDRVPRRTKVSRRHLAVGLRRRAEIKEMYWELGGRLPSEIEVGFTLRGLAEFSPLKRVASSGIWSTAEAQELVVPMEPIVVLSFAEYSADAGFNFASQNAYSSLLAYNSYVNYYLPMVQAQQAAQQAMLAQQPLVNAIEVPPAAEFPAPEEPEPGPSPSPPGPTFSWDEVSNNPYQQYVAERLRDVGLTTAEYLAVAFFGEAAAVAIEAATPLVRTGWEMLAQGLRAGTIAIAVEYIATGLTVSFVGLAGFAIGLGMVAITIYVWNQIEQARTVTVEGQTYTGEVYIEQLPMATEPEAALEPEVSEAASDVPPGTPTSPEQATVDYPWWWDSRNQTWVFVDFGG